jgi:hypothetical protein
MNHEPNAPHPTHARSEPASAALMCDAAFAHETRIAFGLTAQGVADVALVLDAIEPIIPGDTRSWFDGWSGAGRQLLSQARSNDHAGQRDSTSWYLLAASSFLARALRFSKDEKQTGREVEVAEVAREAWADYIRALDGRHVHVPADRADAASGHLFLPLSTNDDRPTLVVMRDSDASLPDSAGYGVKLALDRGWNAYLPARPNDLGNLNGLAGMPDVDETKLLAYGFGTGGYWLFHALASEHRFLAAALDPGIFALTADLNILHRASLVRTPLLIIDPDGAGRWPDQAALLYRQLTGKSALARFTRSQGVRSDGQPLGRSIVGLRLGDYFADQLRKAERDRPPS